MARRETPTSRARLFTSATLLILFVLVASAVAEKNAVFALSPQDSVQRDDSTKNDDSAKEKKESDSVEYPENFSSSWTRLGYRNGAPVAMETSIVSFAGKYQDGEGVERDVQVDLVGAIHIAEKSYYDALNEIFKGYDVVVFEMVSDSDGPYESPEEIARKEENEAANLNPLNIVSTIQRLFGAALNLTYQMHGIDYSAENMKRGDCGSIEFILELVSNGDVGEFFVNSYLEGRLALSEGTEIGMASALLCGSDRRLVARRIFAKELASSEKTDVDSETSSQDGKKRENAVIHFRNKRAIAALQEQLDNGAERVAIFYGAAHLPDLAERLKNEFGFEPTGEIQWIPAWNTSKD